MDLRLPKRPPLRHLALGTGSAASWWSNGLVAVRLGLFLATVPIGYFIYVLIDQRLSGIFQPYADFEPLSILSALVYEVAFWGVAAFAFGCLYAYLPFGNGVLRGAAFSLPFIAANGLSELVPGYQGDSQWLFRSVELLLFTTLLGLLLDIRTVRSERFHRRNLLDLYQVRSLRFGIVNLAPPLARRTGRLPADPRWRSPSSDRAARAQRSRTVPRTGPWRVGLLGNSDAQQT